MPQAELERGVDPFAPPFPGYRFANAFFLWWHPLTGET